MFHTPRQTTQYSYFVSIFLVLFFLCNNSSTCISQTTADWERELSNAKGQDRIDLIIQISEELSSENLTLAESLGLEGFKLAKQFGDSHSMYKIGANLGKLYYSLNEIDEGIEWTKKSLNYFEKDNSLAFEKGKLQLNLASLYISKRSYDKADSLISASESYFLTTNDKLWLSKIQATKGLLFLYKKEYDSALRFYSEALNISKALENKKQTAILKGNIGLIKSHQNQYPEALETLLEVISMNCGSLTKAKVYSSIGGIYRNLEDWELAESYFKKSIKLKEKIGLVCNISYNLYDLGVLHKRQLNYGEGLKYLKQALTLQKKCDLSKANTLGAIGNSYNALGQTDKANRYYEEQMELAKVENDWEGICLVHYNKGYYAFQKKNYNEAKVHLMKSLKIAEEKQKLRSLMKNHAMLANTYEELKMEDSSVYHANKYYMLKDSISSFKKIKKIGAIEQKHHSNAKKDSLNKANQNEFLTAETNGTFNPTNLLFGLSLSALLISIGFWLSKKQANKEKAKEPLKTLDQTKVDQYFKEMLTRLDQLKLSTRKEKDQIPERDVDSINDMSKFLITNLSTSNDWKSFEHYFEKVHKDFFKNLISSYPDITTNEMNMCALLKLNLLNKDIAQIMGISPGSVRKAQSRLSKKLKLSSEEGLREVVLKF